MSRDDPKHSRDKKGGKKSQKIVGNFFRFRYDKEVKRVNIAEEEIREKHGESRTGVLGGKKGKGDETIHCCAGPTIREEGTNVSILAQGARERGKGGGGLKQISYDTERERKKVADREQTLYNDGEGKVQKKNLIYTGSVRSHGKRKKMLGNCHEPCTTVGATYSSGEREGKRGKD